MKKKKKPADILLATANGAVDQQARFQTELMALVRNTERIATAYQVNVEQMLMTVVSLVDIRKSVRSGHYWSVFKAKKPRGKRR